MSADKLLTLDGRPTVRVERRYPHPIERVWRPAEWALARPAQV